MIIRYCNVWRPARGMERRICITVDESVPVGQRKVLTQPFF